MSNLEMATTRELIDELKRRTTFAGILIWSDKEHRDQNQLHDTSNLSLFTSFEVGATVKILDTAKTEIVQC